MRDPFAVFNISRRPWIDPTLLQARFTTLAAELHPDANTAADAEASFSELNQAHRILKEPVPRVRALLELESPDSLREAQSKGVSSGLSDLFIQIATLQRQSEALSKRQETAQNELTRALARTESTALRSELESTLARLDALWSEGEAQIQSADANWEHRSPETYRHLAGIHHEMTFLQRWRSQLRESLLQMQMQAPHPVQP